MNFRGCSLSSEESLKFPQRIGCCFPKSWIFSAGCFFFVDPKAGAHGDRGLYDCRLGRTARKAQGFCREVLGFGMHAWLYGF